MIPNELQNASARLGEWLRHLRSQDRAGGRRQLVVVAVVAALATSAVVAGVGGLAGSAAAQPVPPHTFFGDVTNQDGSAVSGVTVEAVYDGDVVASTTTGSNGEYRLEVDDSDVNQSEDRQITIQVRDNSVTREWEAGGSSEVNFNIADSGGDTTPTEAPTDEPGGGGAPPGGGGGDDDDTPTDTPTDAPGGGGAPPGGGGGDDTPTPTDAPTEGDETPSTPTPTDVTDEGDETPTPTPTPTDAPEEDDDTPTPTDVPDEDDGTPTPTSGQGDDEETTAQVTTTEETSTLLPGFGPVVALVALLSAVWIGIRRSD